MLKRFFTDKDGRIVIAQWPNPPLIIWIVSVIVGRFTHGTVANVISFIGTAALIIWGILEIISGRSMFRRALGVVVLGLTIWGVIARLGS